MDRHSSYLRTGTAGHAAAPAIDVGLRQHMLGIYRNMAIGLGITGAVALGVASTPALYEPIFNTPLKWVAIFAPLAFVLFFSFRIERMSLASARTAFFAFAAVFFTAAFFAAGFAAFFAGFFAVGIVTSLIGLRVWEPLNEVNWLCALGGGPCDVLFSRSHYLLQEKIGASRKNLTSSHNCFLTWVKRARAQLLFDA